MGNYKFRLSDMIPNAWFYKLKDMSKNKIKSHSHTTSSSSSSSLSNLQPDKRRQPYHLSYQRKSYYISRNLSSATDNNHETFSNSPKVQFSHDPPRKSSKKRRNSTKKKRTSPKLVTSSVSASCSCRASLESSSVWTKPDSTPEEYPNSPNSSSSSSPSFCAEKEPILPQFQDKEDPMCGCRVDDNDIAIDMKKKELVNFDHGFQYFSSIDLPHIITKPEKFNSSSKIIRKNEKDEKQSMLKAKQSILNVKQRISSSTGLKLRTNSPRITNNRRIQGNRKSNVSSSSSLSRRISSSVSESFAMVKSSRDPQKDFRDSMVEMIMENNIRASKDLEELLAAYLSLNSDEYHGLIIKVFKQIWFDISDIR